MVLIGTVTMLAACAPTERTKLDGARQARGAGVQSGAGPSFSRPRIAMPPGTIVIEAEKPRIRVAMLAPLSGASAPVGRALRDAAQIALFDAADNRFELRFYDTQGTAGQAGSAAEAAIGDDARLILGPLFGQSAAPVAAAGARADVPVISFSNDRSITGLGAYQAGLSPVQQVRRILSFAASQGRLRLAALIPSTPFGFVVDRVAREQAAAFGIEIVRFETYAADGSDAGEAIKRLGFYDRRRHALKEEIARLKLVDDELSRRLISRLERRDTLGDVDFDAVLVPEGGAALGRIAPLLPFYDIDPAKVQLLGLANWHGPGIGKEPALVGGWFAGPPPKVRAGFEARFSALYGYTPPWVASIGYDLAALAAVLARGESAPDYSSPVLSTSSGFTGMGGLFRFSSSGEVERQLAVIKVTSDGLEVISPAVESFAPVQQPLDQQIPNQRPNQRHPNR